MSDLSLSGIIDMDFSKAEKALTDFVAKMEVAACKMESFWKGSSFADVFASDTAKLGMNLATLGVSMQTMTTNFLKGFGEISQAGGMAFDYIGSRAKSMGLEAVEAQSKIESFNKSLLMFTKSQQTADALTVNAKRYEENSPFVISDIMSSVRKLAAKGVTDPGKNDELLRLAGEMAAVNDKPIQLATEAIRRLLSRSPEAYRSLKTNFNLGPAELKDAGVELDSGDRLRLRTESDVNNVIEALKKHYQAQTGMNAANLQAQTIEGKLSTLRSAMYNALASFADIVAPKIKDLIDKLKDLAHWFQNLDPGVKNTIANFTLFAAGAFTIVGALTPVVAIVGTFATGLGLLAIAAGAAGVALTALNNIIASQSVGGVAGPSGIMKIGHMITGFGATDNRAKLEEALLAAKATAQLRDAELKAVEHAASPLQVFRRDTARELAIDSLGLSPMQKGFRDNQRALEIEELEQSTQAKLKAENAAASALKKSTKAARIAAEANVAQLGSLASISGAESTEASATVSRAQLAAAEKEVVAAEKVKAKAVKALGDLELLTAKEYEKRAAIELAELEQQKLMLKDSQLIALETKAVPLSGTTAEKLAITERRKLAESLVAQDLAALKEKEKSISSLAKQRGLSEGVETSEASLLGAQAYRDSLHDRNVLAESGVSPAQFKAVAEADAAKLLKAQEDLAAARLAEDAAKSGGGTKAKKAREALILDPLVEKRTALEVQAEKDEIARVEENLRLEKLAEMEEKDLLEKRRLVRIAHQEATTGVGLAEKELAENGLIKNPAMEAVGNAVTSLGFKLGEWGIKAESFGTSLAGVAGPIGLLIAGFTGLNAIINKTAELSKAEGKALEDKSKLDTAEKQLDKYQAYLALSKDKQEQYNKVDPTFLARVKASADLLVDQGSGSEAAKKRAEASEEENQANIAAQGHGALTMGKGMTPDEILLSNLHPAARKGEDILTNWASDLFGKRVSGAANEPLNGFSQNQNSSTNDSPIAAIWRAAGKLTPTTQFDKGELAQEQLAKKKVFEEEQSQKLLDEEKTLKEEEKLGILSAKELLSQQLELRKRFSAAKLSTDTQDEDIYKSRVVAIHEQMYNEIDKVRAKYKAKGQLDLITDLELTKQGIALTEKSYYTQAEAAKIVKQAKDSKEALGERPEGGLASRFGLVNDPGLKFMQDRWDAMNKRNEQTLMGKLDKPILGDADQKKLEVEKNHELEIGIELRKKNAEMAELGYQAENKGYEAGMIKLKEMYREKSDLARKGTNDQVEIDKWAAHQQQLLILANEKLTIDSESMILSSKGQFLKAELANINFAAQEKLAHSRKLQVDLDAIEADRVMKQKKAYMEDFINWRSIQNEKKAFYEKLSLDQKGRELRGLEFANSTGGYQNIPEQQAKLGQIRDEEIADARKEAARKTSIIDKQLDAGTDSSGKPLDDKARQHLKDQRAELADGLKSHIEDIQQSKGQEITKLGKTADLKGLSDQEALQQIKLEKQSYQEMILEKKLPKAKTADSVDKMEKKAQHNIKAEYDSEVALLAIQEKKAALMAGADKAAAKAVEESFAQKRIELQEKYLEKMEATTDEMEKQKKLLESQAADKGKFTMGGIYSSYDEIVKHDAETSGLFSSAYNENGGGADSKGMSDSKAGLLLGINPNLKTDIANGINPSVLGKHKDITTKSTFDWYDQYSEKNTSGKEAQPMEFIFNFKDQTIKAGVDKRGVAYNNQTPMGGNAGGCFG